jgi:tetratricopeptide (TPR) repeat protein
MRSFLVRRYPVSALSAATLVLILGISVTFPRVTFAQADVGALIEELADADEARARDIVRDVEREWELSGSTTVDMLFRRAREALESENWTLAIEHFTAVTDHAPEFAEGWHGRATAFWRRGLHGPALSDLGQALALNPQQWDALYGMGILFQELGDYKRAEEAFRMVLDINPHHENAQEALKNIARFGVGREL